MRAPLGGTNTACWIHLEWPPWPPPARCRAPPRTSGLPVASIVTADRNGHVAAAAYPMSTTVRLLLFVLDSDRSIPPVGVITETDISQAAANGKKLDEVPVPTADEPVSRRE